MRHYYVSIARRSFLCHGNNITRFNINPCSYQAVIQLVKPGPGLAKRCIKNRGVWEGALIIWIFSELIYITTGAHNTGLAVKSIAISGKALHCYLIAVLSAGVNGAQTAVILKHLKGKVIRNLVKPRHNGTICSMVLTPCFKQIVQKPPPTNRAHCQKKALIPSKVAYTNLRYGCLVAPMAPGEMQVSLKIRK